MSKNHIIGPALTVLFTVVYHYVTTAFGFFTAVSWIWAFSILGTYISGFWAGVATATWAAAYSWYIDGADPSLLIQRIIIGYIIVLTVGWGRRWDRRKTELLNQSLADGNMEKVREALEEIRSLKTELASQTDNLTGNEWAMMQSLNTIETKLGNTLAIAAGFAHIWNEIQRVETWYRHPANVLRWRTWNEEHE